MGIAVIIGLLVVLLVRKNKENYNTDSDLLYTLNPGNVNMIGIPDIIFPYFIDGIKFQFNLAFRHGNSPSWVKDRSILVISKKKPSGDFLTGTFNNTDKIIYFGDAVFGTPGTEEVLSTIEKNLQSSPVYLYKK